MKIALFYFIGLVLIAIGAGATIAADLGAGALDALAVGISNSFGLSPGNWIIILGGILMAISAILKKSRIDFTSFLTSLILGIFIDIGLDNIFIHLSFDGIAMRWGIYLLGFFIIILGAGLYLQTRFAPTPVDGIALAIAYRFRLELSKARLIFEIITLTLALLVSGPVGIGTVFFTFGIGPCVARSIKFFKPFYEGSFQNPVKKTYP